MKLIAYSIVLLVILEESYCKSTSSVNRTSTSWGYGYDVSDTRGFKVKHDDKGYQLEPFYNNTSSGLKKHFSSRTVYDQFTSPGATNDSPSHSSTNDFINGTSTGTTNSRSNDTVELLPEGDKIPNKVLFETSAGEETTTEFRRVPVTKSHTVTVSETQTEAPIATDKTSYETTTSSHSISVGDMNGSPSVPSNGQLYKTTFGAPYGSQNTPMYVYVPPTGPLYYSQAPSYGQMYGPAGGSMYGISNGQIYGPPMGPMYGPPIASMYGPPTGGMYGPTSPIYELPTRSMYGYAPQNGQMYGPPNGQMYVPQNSQTNGYPTGSLYGSNRNY